MFRIAVRRKSWGMRPGHPAAMQALAHALLNRTIRRGSFLPPRFSATIRKIMPRC